MSLDDCAITDKPCVHNGNCRNCPVYQDHVRWINHWNKKNWKEKEVLL